MQKYLVILALCSGLFACASKPISTAFDSSTLVKEDCWFDQSQVSEPVECYRLSLPQDHSNQDSTLISIPVLHVPAERQKGKAPLIHTGGGGPGGDMGLDNAESVSYTLSTLAELSFKQNRDLFIIDPRGVGLAQPELVCPAISELYSAYFAGDLSLVQLEDQSATALQNCASTHAEQGISLNHYNSMAVVEDLEVLRQSIKAHQIALFGVSYGSVYAKEYAETYPENVAGLVLDSPTFLGSNYFQLRSEMGRQFEQNMQAYCSHFDVCDDYNAMPDIQALHQQLQARSMTSRGYSPALGNFKVEWDEDKLLQFLIDVSYDPWTYDFNLLSWLDSISTGSNLNYVSQMWLELGITHNLNALSFVAHICAEELPFSDNDVTIETQLPWSQAHPFTDLTDTCADLAIEPVAQERVEQQIISQPTLILTGSLDTATTPDYIKSHLDLFENHQIFSKVWTHALLNGDEDVENVVKAFLADL